MGLVMMLSAFALAPTAQAHDSHSPLMQIIKVKLDIEKLQEQPATAENLNKQLKLLTSNLKLLQEMQQKGPNLYRNQQAFRQSLDERLSLLQEHTQILQNTLNQLTQLNTPTN